MLNLERKGLRLEVDPERGTYALHSLDNPKIFIQEAWLAYQLNSGRQIFAEFLELQSASPLQQAGPGGTQFEGFELSYFDKLHHLDFIVEIGLIADQPMSLVRERLVNSGQSPVWPERLFAGIIHRGKLMLGSEEMEPTFYSNGWQSWSPTTSYRLGDKQDRSWMGPIANPMIVNPGTPLTHSPNHFSADMFACLGDLTSQNGLVAGYLAQKESFGTIETHIGKASDLTLWANSDGLRLDPGRQFRTDWASFSFTDLRAKLPFKLYLQSVSRENQVHEKVAAPVGWCSWYYYFQNVTEKDIYENLEELDRIRESIPLKLVQIDDGFEKSVGEWLEFSKRFPNGVKPLAQEIEAKGFIPGLWLAPYIVEAHSGLIKQHPDWLLRDRWGRPANSGFVWNRLGKALDLTNPAAMTYTEEVIRTAVQDWGFKYLKLDFLYAAALAGRYQNPTFTRAQVLREGLERIRAAAGDETWLLGCGCPIGPAIGLMDYMRISSDVSPDWEPTYFGHRRIFKNERNMPSARNAIRNMISRSELDGFWWGNDPDCLLVREDSNLDLNEVRSLATTIGMTGGAILVSDRMPTLSQDRRAIIQALLPVIPSQPQVLDRFERKEPYKLKQELHTAAGVWPVIAIFNWEPVAKDLIVRPTDWGFPDGKTWITREFWSGEVHVWQGDLTLHEVPKHGVKLFTLHELTGGSLYLGSDFHFSQGYEVKSWREEGNSLIFKLSLGRLASGRVFLWLPSEPETILQDGNEILWETTAAENIYSFIAEIIWEAQFSLKLREQ
jgi:alpha-galactosidase